jgi:histidinol phosphatase-like enzyme
MNTIIFLDIDGVLNCTALNDSHEIFITINDIQYDPMCLLSSSRIKNLNHITEETGAKIVITSTWRKYVDVDEMLIKAGVTGEIVGHTPDMNQRCVYRGNEIQLWIDTNVPYDNRQTFKYVIIDDDSDMLYWQRNNLVLCDGECGLSVNAAYKAINILRN